MGLSYNGKYTTSTTLKRWFDSILAHHHVYTRVAQLVVATDS